MAKVVSNKKQILEFSENLARFGLFSFVLFLPNSIAFSQIGLGFIMVAYLIESLVTRQFRFIRNSLDLPILCFVLVTFTSAIFGMNALKSLKTFFPSLFPVLVFYLVFYYLGDTRSIKKLITLLLIVATLISVYGITQHFWKVDWLRLSGAKGYMRTITDLPDAAVRIPGTFSISMTFAGQLIMILSLVWTFLLFDRSRKNKIPLAISAVVLFLALIWTYTRSAWLGFGLALLFLGCWKGRKHFLILILGAILSVTGIFLIQPTVLERAKSMFSLEQNADRIYIWKRSIEMIKDHPVTGIGQGNYNALSRGKYYKPHHFEKEPSHAHAHNNLLMIMVDRGVFGLIVFVWLWITIFKKTFTTLQKLPPDRPYLQALVLGCLAAFIAFFVEGFFENNFGDSEVGMLLWFLVALVMIVKEKLLPQIDSLPADIEEFVSEERRMLGVLIFAVLVIMVVMATLHLTQR